MTKNGQDKASVREVYTLIEKTRAELMAAGESTRKELSGSLLRLEGKFDALEAGRLSHLETSFANLQGKISIVAGVISVVVSLVFVLINYFLK